MCAKPACDSPSRRPVPRFRLSRNAKHLDLEVAKVALDFIFRPSFQLWKLALNRSALSALKRPSDAVILDDASSTSPITHKKKVRFNERPVTISRRGFFERRRKDSCSSPARPCLVIRLHDDVRHKPPEPSLPSLEADSRSVYEDCLSDHPSFLADLHVLEGDECSHTRPARCICRSEFYETESGIAMFDRAGYASYCLSRWLDKQREEARVPKKALEDPVHFLQPAHTLSPTLSDTLDDPHPVLLLPSPIYKPPRSFFRRIYKCVEDELQNAIAVLIIGLFIHICLIIFLLYDILTRGLIPSDD